MHLPDRSVYDMLDWVIAADIRGFASGSWCSSSTQANSRPRLSV